MKKYILFSILPFLIACGGSEKDKKAADELARKDSMMTKTYNIDPEKAIGIGRIEPETKIIKLYADVSGIVEELYIKAGVDVKKGQQILALTHSLEEAKTDKVRAQIAAQEVQVKSQQAQVDAQGVQIQTQQTQVENFEKDIAKARLAVQFAQKNFDRISKVYKEGAETRQSYENAENQVQTAQAEVERLLAQQNNLRAQINNLKAQQETLRAQKSNASSKVGELKADESYSRVERSKRDMYAFTDGKILSVDIAVGSYISPQVPIGDFAPASPVNVVAEIDELFATKVQVGQRAQIRLQGAADILAEGNVIEVAPYLRQKSLFSDEIGKLEDRRVREVRVRLDNPPASLLYGTRVDCIIKLK